MSMQADNMKRALSSLKSLFSSLESPLLRFLLLARGLMILLLAVLLLLLPGCSSKTDIEPTTQSPIESTTVIRTTQTDGVSQTVADQQNQGTEITAPQSDAAGDGANQNTSAIVGQPEPVAAEGVKREPRAGIDQRISPPEGVLPSGVAYADLEREIDAYVAQYQYRTAAMSVAVFTAEGVLLEKAYGFTDADGLILNNAEAVFDWGSTTKTLVWVSAMQLAEQGKLDLEADIRTYLSEGFFSKLQHDDPITMIHLMNHTSGWPRNAEYGVQFIGDIENAEPKELAELLPLMEPVQKNRPGEVQQYSNYAPPVAAHVIERITGMPFYDYVSANIFQPSGMQHTAFKSDLSDNVWVKQQRNTLNCWQYDSLFELQTLGTAIGIDLLYPAGMGTGTLSDLRRYGQVLLADANGKSPLFEKAETLALLYMPTMELTRPVEEGDMVYGDSNFASSHGFRKETRFLTTNTISHAGGTLGCSSNLIVDLELGVGIAIMSNQVEDLCFCANIPGMIFGPYPEEFQEDELGFEITGSAEAVESGIRITWEQEDESTEYWVFRSVRIGSLLQINEKLATGGEYLDTTADPNVSYLYTVVEAGGDPAKGIRAFYRKSDGN